MITKPSFVTKAFSFINQLNELVEEIIRRSLMNNAIPALSLGNGAQLPQIGDRPSFDIKSIFEKGLVWCPTPKHRTSAEKKLTKRFTRLPNSLMTKYAKAKANIVTCLECGSYHERNTICGKCYARVREETRQLHELMFDKNGHNKNDSYQADKEVKFVYEGEAEGKKKEGENENSSRFNLVEVPRKRPSWFDNNLKTKVSSDKLIDN